MGGIKLQDLSACRWHSH